MIQNNQFRSPYLQICISATLSKNAESAFQISFVVFYQFITHANVLYNIYIKALPLLSVYFQISTDKEYTRVELLFLTDTKYMQQSYVDQCL